MGKRRSIAANEYTALGLCLLGALLGLALGSPATAQEVVGRDGLPGVERIALPLSERAPTTLATGLTYGFTEAAAGTDEGHHQEELDVALSLSPLSAFALALRIHGQLDHNEDGTAFLGRSHLVLRHDVRLGERARLGWEAGAALPAAAQPGRALSGAGGHARLLAGYASPSFQLGTAVGLAVDRGVHAVDNIEQLAVADRVSLEISVPPLLQLGLATALYAGELAWLLEWSWEVGLGADAVGALQTPMWVRVGARLPLSPELGLLALAGVSPSGRPGLAEDQPLQRLEPRVAATVRLVYTFDSDAASGDERARSSSELLTGQVLGVNDRPVPDAQVEVSGRRATTDEYGRFSLRGLPQGVHTLRLEAADYRPLVRTVAVGTGKPSRVVLSLSPQPVALSGQIVDPAGEPIPGAQVGIGRGAEVRYTTTDEQGRYAFSDQVPGTVVLTIEAPGFPYSERTLEIGAGGAAQQRVALVNAVPQGQIRGTVRAFDGTPLGARITVRPGGRTTSADRTGQFTLDVPPGEYLVDVRMPGFSPQTRRAKVEERGVTVLIIDLRKQR